MVLGGTGFIGRWVARLLSARGARIILGVRDQALATTIVQRYGITAEIACVDVETDPGAMRDLIVSTAPALIVNLAGYGVDRSERNERSAYAINAELPGQLCEWMAALDTTWSGCRVVHVGSALEYGELSNDLSETSQPQPTTLYGQSKLLGTERVTQFSRDRQFRALTARLFTVYGCGEHQGRLLPSLIEAARTGADLPMTEGKQERDFCFVEDVAEGLLRLAAAPWRGDTVVNLATGSLNSVRTFAELAAAQLGMQASQLKFGEIPGRMEEMAHLPVNVERLRQCTGWLPPADLRAGIGRSLDYEQTLSL